MNVTIGGAADSWGIWFPSDPKQMPWQRFLDEVAEAGYQWIELGPYGYLPDNIGVLRSALDSRGLKVSANWAMAHLEDPGSKRELDRQVLGAGELLAALDAEYLLLIDATYTDEHTGSLIAPTTINDDSWKRMIETTHTVADLVHERFNLKLVFHPHVDTHVQYEHEIEYLLENTDPDRVALCLDTGHHAYLGGDPVSFMRRHHARIPYLHLKNIDADIQGQVQAGNDPFSTAVSMGIFCEPSRGLVDFLEFRDVLRDVDYVGHATVEQDMYPVEFDTPLPIAKRTREYLRDIGIG